METLFYIYIISCICMGILYWIIPYVWSHDIVAVHILEQVNYDMKKSFKKDWMICTFIPVVNTINVVFSIAFIITFIYSMITK